jgi:hypothetical protein
MIFGNASVNKFRSQPSSREQQERASSKKTEFTLDKFLKQRNCFYVIIF